MADPLTGRFAVLTPPGRGGIAVVRAAGPGASAAVAAHFSRALPSPGRLAYGHFLDADGAPLDEVIVARLGPEALEVNCHGGPAAVEAIASRLAAAGLAEADPVELMASEGAGRLEVTCERLLQAARTPLVARIVLDQMRGALSRALEAAIREVETAGTSSALDALIRRWETAGRLIAARPAIVVAGPPNVGKSTLVNRLAREDRVLTDPSPGTTRDWVEVEAALGAGLSVTLIDTAGLRDAREAIERAGIDRARDRIRGAGLVLVVLDATAGLGPQDRRLLDELGERALAVWNKTDLVPAPLDPGGPAVSAATGAGIDALESALLGRLGWREPSEGAAVPLDESTASALAAAQSSLASGRRGEACLRLRKALPAG